METGGVELKVTKKWTLLRRYEPDNNLVFYLYRSVTFAIFYVIFSSIIFYVYCDVKDMVCYENSKIPEKVFSTYCWVQGTHTVERLHDPQYSKIPYPGMGQINRNDTVIYHWAYKWVYPYLGLTWIVLIFPWYLWLHYFDGKRIMALMAQLDVLVVENPEDIQKKKDSLLNYFTNNLQTRVHNGYAFRYIMCEVLNFLITLGLMYLTDHLLYGEFSLYGWQVVEFLTQNQATRVDPLAKVFPKMTTCHLSLIGHSGNTQLHEGICVLPMNSLFEKIFVVLWVWYYLLAIASVIGLTYRAITVFIPPFRYWLLRRQVAECPDEIVQFICKKSSYGDWLILFTLKNVMDGFLYDEILEAYGQRLKRICNE